jgi:hypothetical protein
VEEKLSTETISDVENSFTASTVVELKISELLFSVLVAKSFVSSVEIFF